MKNHLQYWALVLVFSYGCTIGIQYLFRPFWFIKSDTLTGLSLCEMVWTIIILPIVLVTAVYLITKRYNKKNWFLLSSVIICSCIYLSAQLDFFNWADSIGSRQNPDYETLNIVRLEWQAGLIVTFPGLIVSLVRLYRKRETIS